MTVTIKTILVPTEIQDATSLKAVSYAVALGKLFGASVTLLHVIEEPPLPQFLLKEDSVRQTRLLEEAEMEVRALFEREIAPHVEGRYIIREGRSCETPVKVAREINADLIVMFSHAWSGLAKLINACPVEKIVRSVPCPVLVVKDKEHEFIA